MGTKDLKSVTVLVFTDLFVGKFIYIYIYIYIMASAYLKTIPQTSHFCCMVIKIGQIVIVAYSVLWIRNAWCKKDQIEGRRWDPIHLI